VTATAGTALLGCGRIAALFHLPILAGLEGSILRAVAEPDPGRRAAAGARAGTVTVVDDYRTVLADVDVDAVVVCLPSGLHAEAACAAFEAGKHVYLEKPIATTLPDARCVQAAWRSAGTVGMIGFNQRFDPVVTALRRAVEEGQLGTVTGARIMLGAATRTPPAWKQHRVTGGGVLLDLGSHAADLTRFVFGQEVRSVTATVMSHRFEHDTAALTMVLWDGRLVQAHLTSTAAQESRCELLGERGRLVADRYAGTLELQPPLPPYSAVARARRGLRSLRRLPSHAIALVAPPHDAHPYRAALHAFIGAVRGERPCSPDLDDGYRSLAVVAAAEEAALRGRSVEVEVAAR